MTTAHAAVGRDAGRSFRIVDIINVSSSADRLLKARVLAMRASGFDNRIVCADGPYVAALREAGIPVHTVHIPRRLSPFRLLISLVEIATYLRRERVDLVHTHCSVPGAVGRAAAWLARVPVVIHTVHGFHFHARTPWPKRLPAFLAERLAGLLTDTLLTQNRSDLGLAEHFGIGPRGRRRWVGNGIEIGRFRLAARPARADAPATIVCVARLEPVKNHPMLFDAVRLLKSRGESFRVLLVGDGALRSSYQAECERLEIADRIEFLGYRDDIPELLAISDIAVLTSLKEGMPRAVLEAMATGLPVVATRVPGTSEAVHHGETGLTVAPGDVDGLAASLALLIGDPELRRAMGARGHAVAVRSYDERAVIGTLRSIYRERLSEVVRSRAPRRGPNLSAAIPDALAVEGNGPEHAVRIGRNIALRLASQAISALVNVAAMVLLGRTLTARGYGEYAFYYALIPLVAAVGDAGVGLIVTREIARDRRAGPRLLGDAILIKAAVSGLILTVVVATAWPLLPPARAALVTLLAAIALIDLGQDPSVWTLRAHERLDLEALLLVVSQVVWFLLLAAGAWLRAGLFALLLAAAVAFAIRLALGAVIVARRFHRPEFRPEPERMRRLVAEGLPFGAAMAASVLYGRIGLLMLAAFSSPVDVACFNVGYLLSQPFGFIASAVTLGAFPALARRAQREAAATGRALRRTLRYLVLAAFPLSVGLVVLARPLIDVLFRGHGFERAPLALIVLGPVLTPIFLNLAARYVLAALDRQERYLRGVIAGLVTNAAFGAFLIPRFGFMGACLAYAAAELAIAAVCMRALSPYVRLAELARDAARPLVAAAGMAAAMLAVRAAPWPLAAALGCATYAALLRFLGALPDGEIRILQQIPASLPLPLPAALRRTGSGG